MAVLSVTDLAARLEGAPPSMGARRVGARPQRPEPVREVGVLAERVRPTTLAGEQVVPVREDLAALLPFGGIRRGTVVQLAHLGLLAASLAAAMAEGSWAAAIGAPTLGLAAAAEHGVPMQRFAVVATPPPEQAAVVVGALLDAVELVIVGPGVITRAADARRLAARLRERRGVLFSLGAWPEAPELRIEATGASWHGAEHGHGHLAGCELEVVVQGRGAAARGRRGVVRLGAADERGGVGSEVAVVEQVGVGDVGEGASAATVRRVG